MKPTHNLPLHRTDDLVSELRRRGYEMAPNPFLVKELKRVIHLQATGLAKTATFQELLAESTDVAISDDGRDMLLRASSSCRRLIRGTQGLNTDSAVDWNYAAIEERIMASLNINPMEHTYGRSTVGGDEAG